MKLKRNHAYFFQVQLSLAIMELEYCDFIIWSPHGMLIEKIIRDEQIISELTAKLIKIHCEILLVEFFEMRIPRNLKLLHLSSD